MEEGREVRFPVEEIKAPERERRFPYEEIARKHKISTHRLRRLLNTGKVAGVKRRKEKGERGYPWRWFTTEKSVGEYLASLKTPSEYGRKPPKPGSKRRGRPEKSSIGKQGLVFQAS